MTPNNNLSALPFYTSLNGQNHRKDYSFGEIFPLIAPNNKILPFQIIRPHSTGGLSAVKLMKMDGSEDRNLISDMISTGIGIHGYAPLGYDVIYYPGLLTLSSDIEVGRYYLEIYDSVQTWYSEVFTVVDDIASFLKISYGDNESLFFEGGMVDYQEYFRFNIYLPTQVGRPEYTFEEEVEDRDGYQFVEKQISSKTFKFNFLAPEFLCDAMRLIRMSDNIHIFSRGEAYKVNQFLITPKWEDGGYLAAVEAEFQCFTVLKKIAGYLTALTSNTILSETGSPIEAETGGDILPE